MKIQGPSGTQSTSKSKKSSGAGKSGSNFSDFMDSGSASGASGASASSSINNIDALLAVQGADDPAARAAKTRMKNRAHTILDKLDQLKVSMLCGSITIGELMGIADTVANHREKIDDPQLTSILDEIDLRAQIEIAKLSKSMKD